MTLLAYNITTLVPTFVDGMQYTGTALPGTSYTNHNGWVGTFATYSTSAPNPEGLYGPYGAKFAGVVGGSAYRQGVFPDNQWACFQGIVPFYPSPDSHVGVRCSDGNGYFLNNSGYLEYNEWWFELIRINNGIRTVLAQWQALTVMEKTSSFNPDGAFIILEVTGQNPVQLRASWALSPWGTGIPPWQYETAGPHDFPVQVIGEPEILGVYTDSSPSRILSGTPGFRAAGSEAGGFYGFNAGNLPDTDPPVITLNYPAGTYSQAIGVTFSSNEPATILYTLDGSDPKDVLTIDEVTNTVAMDNGTPITDGIETI